MKNLIKTILAATLLWFGVTSIQATKMILFSADGDETTFALSEIRSITFENAQDKMMTVNKTDGEKETNVRKIVFTQETTENAINPINTIRVYPNPVSEYIKISGAGKTPKVTITNLSGVVVKEESSDEIQVSSLPAGAYILVVDNQCIRFVMK